jgi:hypothetical protein
VYVYQPRGRGIVTVRTRDDVHIFILVHKKLHMDKQQEIASQINIIKNGLTIYITEATFPRGKVSVG